ncbi:hypothetical protein HID58_043611 [Brassica napus]|uniref:Uncharacterized protein n=1 Tax=Brassica napus TaxID=3708 RepID=A0ABQ8BH76_BRANA|nr:hypothetical protein HID58_043611 [Brassica napus]
MIRVNHIDHEQEISLDTYFLCHFTTGSLRLKCSTDKSQNNFLSPKKPSVITSQWSCRRRVSQVPLITKYCLEAKIVKTLGDGDIWNNLLTTKNIRNNKKLLAGIKALPEANYDQICEAVDDIMNNTDTTICTLFQASLTSEFHLKRCTIKKGDDMKPIVRATSKCVEACYSFDEMHETLSARFGQPRRTTQKMSKLEKIKFMSKLGKIKFLS